MNGPTDLFVHAATPPTHPAPKSTGTRGRPVRFIVYEGEDSRIISPRGRDAWALASMLSAGASGCTPIDHVGPRWSHYIWKLRTVYGLTIESVEEQHGGEFAGRHVRYVLRSRVAVADPADASWIGGAQ